MKSLKQQAEIAMNKQDEETIKPKKAYFAMFIMMLLYMTKNWQQATLSYFYGFQGVGDQFKNPKFEMGTSFPQLDLYYGLLSGLVFDVPYSICGLLMAGLCTSKYRVMILGAFMLSMSGI